MIYLTEQQVNSLPPTQKAEYLRYLKLRREGANDGGDGPGVMDNDNGRTAPEGQNIDPKDIAIGVGNAAYDMTLGQLPGIGPALKTGVKGIYAGDDAETIAKDSLKSGAYSGAKYGLNQLAGGLPVNPAINMVKDTQNRDPNLLASSIQNLAPAFVQGATSMVNPLVGSIAGSLSDYYVKNSLEGGWVGDAIDSRHNEMDRDDLEDQGYNREESDDILAGDIDMSGGYSLGYEAKPSNMQRRNEFTSPNVSNYNPSADNPPPNTLASYVSSRRSGGSSASGGRSASQSQGDYGDRGSVAGGKGGV